jgi:hypothetical protein
MKHAARRPKRKTRFDPLPRPSLRSTLVFGNQFEKADDLLPRRRLAERMSLETRKRRLFDACDDSPVTNPPNATASEAVTGRAITSFVMTSWPAAFPSRTKYEARADFASRPKGNLIRRYRELLSGKSDKLRPGKHYNL